MTKFTMKDIAGTTLELDDEQLLGGSILTLKEGRVALAIFVDPLSLKELRDAIDVRLKHIDKP